MSASHYICNAEERFFSAYCLRLAACFVLAHTCFTAAATAQTTGYPSKPIRFVIPYPPGGGSDTIARPLAQRLAELRGQQVVVDNRGGAGGAIGMDAVAHAAADGYTMGMALTAQL